MAKKQPFNLRAFRSDIAKLKKSGLIKNVDARSVQPTKHYKAVIKKNADVLSGKAQVIKIHKGSARVASDLATKKSITRARLVAQENGKRLRTSSGRIIIERIGNQKITYNKKTGKLETKIYNDKTKKYVVGEITPSNRDFKELEKAGYEFHVFFNRGRGKTMDERTWQSADDLVASMSQYHKWVDWPDYVIITKRQ